MDDTNSQAFQDRTCVSSDGLTLHLLWTERQKTGFEALTSERGNDA